MKNFLVTGGAGFIGSSLVKSLIHSSNKITVFDNLERGKIDRLNSIKDEVEIINGDIRDFNEVEKAAKGSDVIYHLAAVNGTENFYKHPKKVLEVGLKGILNVMDASIKHSVEHIVIASSAEVYQTPSTIPTPEREMLKIPNPLEERYSYGASKIASELVAFNWAREANCVQVFRPHNIYGPDMGWKHVIPNLINKMIQIKMKGSKDLNILGSGLQTRAFCYVDDLIDGLHIMQSKGSKNELFHIGTQEEISIKELIQIISEIMEIEVKIIPSKAPKGEAEKRCPDISKMRKLGYSPNFSIRDGLEKTIKWYLNNPFSLKENDLL
tara:strand:- start:1536 stop:2510 length:975 start_codon:yes stop_codon:yes gene_type:complete